VSQHHNLSWQEITVVATSLANVCLMVLAAFYREAATGRTASPPWRVTSGYVAVTLGLCSQIFYCLMLLVWRYGWVPFDPGVNSVIHLEVKLANIGGLLSTATVLAALFGKGLRRYAGVWVGATTFWFWSFVGWLAALESLFR
jgi:hypothetical protein